MHKHDASRARRTCPSPRQHFHTHFGARAFSPYSKGRNAHHASSAIPSPHRLRPAAAPHYMRRAAKRAVIARVVENRQRRAANAL
ncbi:protein of unknown function [Paraburkholderia kururiensis]